MWLLGNGQTAVAHFLFLDFQSIKMPRAGRVLYFNSNSVGTDCRHAA
jgi:hypothetical protein